jgi:hypothetical protein
MTELSSISHRSPRSRGRASRRAAFAGLAAGAALFAGAYLVAAATAPSLGAAATYSILAGQTVTNTGATTISGDLGVSPGSAVTGFPPGIVTLPGTIHAADTNAAAAQIANSAAFDFLDQGCVVSYPGTKDLVGENLVPGVYGAGAFTLTGTLTLSGSGVWIFKSASTFITSGTARVVGGEPCNVWWRVVSSATLGTNTSLVGSILASTSITMATGATLSGRALAQTGSVTMAGNTVSNAICAAVVNPTASPVPSASASPSASPVTSASSSPTPSASPAPVASAIPTMPPTTTDPASQGGSSPWLLVLALWVASGLVLSVGFRLRRGRAR